MRGLLLILASASACFGWGCEGHQIVALIARAHLSPGASAAVDDLLASQPMDPALSRYCKDKQADLMADASTWADDVKRTELTGAWHYIDIPRGIHNADLTLYCEPVGESRDGKDRPGCILDAVEYELGILKDKTASPPNRAQALRYLIHFVGDMHQPLHTTNNNDRGGNCVPIQFFDKPRKSNLHAIWDTDILQRDFASRKLATADAARDVDQSFENELEHWCKDGADFEQWLWEGHRIAEKATYGKLRPHVPVEVPDPSADCALETTKTGALHLSVTEKYQDQSGQAIEAQLAKAGYRLAMVLNSVWN